MDDVTRCARVLRQQVMTGALAPGDKLPSERELAERFGVSRVTLRPALARLQAAGLLARRGRRTVVQDPLDVGGPDLLPDVFRIARDQGQLAKRVEELFFVRQHLARGLLERIAARRPDPAPFHRAVAAFAATHPTDLEAFARADAEVLASLVDLADNAVLRLCINPVRHLLMEQPELRAAMYTRPDENVAGWQAMAVWVADPHPDDIDVLLSLIRARDASTLRALS